MKIIYDEERAKKRAKRNFVVDIILSSCLCVGLVLCICSLALDIDYIGLAGGVLLAGSYIFLRFSSHSSFPLRSAKDSDLVYLKLSQKYEIKEVKVEKRILKRKTTELPYFSLVFIGENKEGKVKEIFEGILEKEINTKVKEETVDLEKGILYHPYLEEKNKGGKFL